MHTNYGILNPRSNHSTYKYVVFDFFLIVRDHFLGTLCVFLLTLVQYKLTIDVSLYRVSDKTTLPSKRLYPRYLLLPP